MGPKCNSFDAFGEKSNLVSAILDYCAIEYFIKLWLFDDRITFE